MTLGYFLDERKGLSTRPDSKKMIEDTVIGLRYGNYDGLFYHKIPEALRYDITSIRYLDKCIPLKDIIPNYEMLVKKRKMESILKGPKSFILLGLDQFKTTTFIITLRHDRRSARSIRKWGSKPS